MAFVNERFPDAISFGAIERVRHSTNVVRVNSGARSANKNWAFPLREFDVSHAARIKSYMDTLLAFNFAVAEGMANTFRYKAWGDYKVAAGEGVLTLISGANYQMAKRYTFGSVSKDRKITLPIAAEVVIAGGGAYTFDELTGIVTKVSGANPTGWIGQFDLLAYFGTDVSEFSIKDKSGGELVMGNEQITLLEDR